MANFEILTTNHILTIRRSRDTTKQDLTIIKAYDDDNNDNDDNGNNGDNDDILTIRRSRDTTKQELTIISIAISFLPLKPIAYHHQHQQQHQQHVR